MLFSFENSPKDFKNSFLKGKDSLQNFGALLKEYALLLVSSSEKTNLFTKFERIK